MFSHVLPSFRHVPVLRSALALLVIASASCTQDDPTAPGAGGRPAPAEPPIGQLATAKTNIWASKAPMPTARTALATGVINDVVYGVGGVNATGAPLATVQAYNPATNAWSTKASLPQPRGSFGTAGVINGILYIAGGTDASEAATRTLYAYNPSTNAWSTKASLPVASGCGASGVISGKLYVYGDCTTPTFQRYDPATNTWKSLALPKFKHLHPAGAALGGKLYLAGGVDESGYSTTVEAYDPGRMPGPPGHP